MDKKRTAADRHEADVHEKSKDGPCGVCGNYDVNRIATIVGAPTNCHMLCSSPEQAQAAPVGNIRLGFCGSCGMISNVDFDPKLIEYQRGYDNALHHSPRFQAYAEELASHLVEEYQLYGKTLVEIGCGDGYFLRQLCKLGDNRGWGFDPSAESSSSVDANVTIVAENFDATNVPDTIDFVCCRHVLEHLSEPRQFTHQLRKSLPAGTTVYFEVPDGSFTLARGGIWDILYEHCSYFTDSAITHLFQQAGFEILRTTSAYDGQFLQLEAVATTSLPEQSQSVSPQRLELAARFEQAYTDTIAYWKQQLKDFATAGQSVALWGAGTKGIMFLNTLSNTESVAGVVDINPNKQGRFVAGTGTPIVAPEVLISLAPDAVLLTNPTYAEEVRGILDELGVRSEIVPIS